ncbi:hypothetical protein EK21DRAFT_91290 [Setomelanomma holmii]|uniref:Homeobox domain-containing protein n=1 Tax=Setomelanomma holmii TaxID=210430 RepID=A0A9P4LKH8_9PLEO|nr:hypothetical protein EK21DRAFT_91290 [Setomelanomma holmii]
MSSQPLADPIFDVQDIKLCDDTFEQLKLDHTGDFFDFEAFNSLDHDVPPSPTPQLMDCSDHDATCPLLNQPCDHNFTASTMTWTDPGAIECSDALRLDGVSFSSYVSHMDMAEDWLASTSLDPAFGTILSTAIERSLTEDENNNGLSNQPFHDNANATPTQGLIAPLPTSHASTLLDASAKPTESSQRPRSKRAKINEWAKDIMSKQFRVNPYPDDEETSLLSKVTNLTKRTIRTWFTNTRSRIKGGEESQPGITNHRDPPSNSALSILPVEHLPPKRNTSPSLSLCQASLEPFESNSDAASMESLLRYLAAPIDTEAIPRDKVRALVNESDKAGRTKSAVPGQNWANNSLENYPFAMGNWTRSTYRSPSIHSGASGLSNRSQVSFRSEDSRGSRRGRKLWTRAHDALQPLTTRASQTQSSDLHDSIRSSSSMRARDLRRSRSRSRRMTNSSEPSNGGSKPVVSLSSDTIDLGTSATGATLKPYFCTMSSCNATFQHDWEWRRHEEAVHYQPYHWVCCLRGVGSEPLPECWICGEISVSVNHFADQHFTSCAQADVESRTFLREDHLLQHIAGVHTKGPLKKGVIKDLLSLWKIPNAAMQTSHLTCGFCWHTCRHWEERQKHVSEHIRKGYTKSGWRSEHLAAP